MNFPPGEFNGYRMTFHPEPLPSDFNPAGVLVFVIHDGKFLVGNVLGRGYCIPGGGIEEGETPDEALEREIWEEVKASIFDSVQIGYFYVEKTDRYFHCYIAPVGELLPFEITHETISRKLVDLEWLRENYFSWNDLYEVLFPYALEQFKKHFPAHSLSTDVE
ncbi:MAG: NUDIX hydrolase [Armatimonadetes bacterium]|nr:NUDIX hydrolase [Armatimonadota bacterium]